MSRTILFLLAETSLRATAAALLVGAALSVLRATSGATRHAAWTAVLLAMLAMPGISRVAPTIDLPIPDNGLLTPRWVANAPTADAGTRPRLVDGLDPGAAPPPHDRQTTIEAGLRQGAGPLLGGRVAGEGWPTAVVFVYASVAAALCVRLVIGWLAAAQILRRSVAAGSPYASVICQSAAVSVPATVGVLRPAVLLPSSWTTWPRDTLRAVLAHELAHARRRDPLGAFLARLNCAVFWFHPLSWWLERTLAAAAEDACDDEAVSALENRAQYAAIVLDMARAASRANRRAASVSAGIGGAGAVRRRIERMLADPAPQRTSPMRRVALPLSCGAAILIAVACEPTFAPPRDARLEQRDRLMRTTLEQILERDWRELADAGWDAGPAPLDGLDAAARANPDDLGAVRRFLVAYWAQYAPSSGVVQNPLIANRVVDARLLAARREHVLRLIARHPESDLAGAIEARIFDADLPAFFPGDPMGYRQATSIWLALTERADVSAVVLGHAADFFERSDKTLAEQLLRRAQALDSDGPWTARLGRLYAIALSGFMVPSGRNAARTVSAPEPHTAFGERVRHTLGESTDDRLVTAAGWFLALVGSGRDDIDFDPRFWAESCFSRALEINPRGILAHALLLNVRSAERLNREPLWRVPSDAVDARIASLPEAERFVELPDRARIAFAGLVNISRWDDPIMRDRQHEARARSQRYADAALALAPKFRRTPQYGTAVYTANMTLSALALRDGDTRTAVARLGAASHAPATEELVYGDDVVSRWRALLSDLIAAGERQAVIDYLDRMARISLADRIDLRAAAADLVRGGVPTSLRRRG